MNSVEIVGNLLKIEFSSNVVPNFIEKKGKDWVYFGNDNNYPAFILDMYRRHPEHNAILKAKSKYIAGKGLEATDQVSQIFLSKANRYEDWGGVWEKTVRSLEIYNGFCWQVIWSLGGTSYEVYLLQLANVRVSKDGKKYYYSEEWVDQNGFPKTRPEVVEFDAFNPNVRTGTQLYYYQVPDQTIEEYGETYPMPEYIGAMINISTDVGVAEFQNSLVENGMTAQGMLSLFNGNPTEVEKKQYAKMFNNAHTGPSKAGRVIFNFVDPGDNAKGAEWTTFTASDLDKQFELISKNNQQKIFTGHQITNKSLFGIATEGALSDRTTIIESYEQFQNSYVEPRQKLIHDEIVEFAALLGLTIDFTVIKLAPLGVDITDPNVSKYFTEDEIREKLGYGPKLGSGGVPVAQGQVNENLQGLTGKDWIHIKRIIREVSNGKVTRDAGALMIKGGYGLSDQDIETLFGMPQATFNAFVRVKLTESQAVALFLSAASDETNDEVIAEEYCFADYSGNETDLKNGVLDILTGNPLTSIEAMAKQLGVTTEDITNALALLVTGGLILSDNTVTSKGLEKKIPTVETETYTVYKYVTRLDVPSVKTETRPFCKELLAASQAGKEWTRQALDSLSNDLGEDAWAYRGGFYTNPKTKETTPYCRHIWKAITKTRRKK